MREYGLTGLVETETCSEYESKTKKTTENEPDKAFPETETVAPDTEPDDVSRLLDDTSLARREVISVNKESVNQTAENITYRLRAEVMPELDETESRQIKSLAFWGGGE